MSERKKENKVSIGKKERKNKRDVWGRVCVCLPFLSFVASGRSLQARRQLWSVERESGGSSRNGDGDRGKGGTDVWAGGRAGVRVGRYARNVRGASNSGLAR
jgi:hypothetical protein